MDGHAETKPHHGGNRLTLFEVYNHMHNKAHAETVGAKEPAKLPPYGLDIGGGKPFPENLPDPGKYLVDFHGHDDPLQPQNWATRRK